MVSPRFDTLKLARKLKDANNNPDVLAAALNESLQENLYSKDEVNAMLNQIIATNNENLVKSLKELSDSGDRKIQMWQQENRSEIKILSNKIESDGKATRRTAISTGISVGFALAGLMITILTIALHNAG